MPSSAHRGVWRLLAAALLALLCVAAGTGTGFGLVSAVGATPPSGPGRDTAGAPEQPGGFGPALRPTAAAPPAAAGRPGTPNTAAEAQRTATPAAPGAAGSPGAPGVVGEAHETAASAADAAPGAAGRSGASRTAGEAHGTAALVADAFAGSPSASAFAGARRPTGPGSGHGYGRGSGAPGTAGEAHGAGVPVVDAFPGSAGASALAGVRRAIGPGYGRGPGVGVAAAVDGGEGRSRCGPGPVAPGRAPAVPVRAGGHADHALAAGGRPALCGGTTPCAVPGLSAGARGPDRPAPGPVELSVMRV